MSMTTFQHENYEKILNISAKHSTGTAIVYKKGFKKLKSITDDNNRIIKVEFDELIVVNIYGYPRSIKYTANDRTKLFNEVLAGFLKPGVKPTMLMGDFNATIYQSESGWYSHVLADLVGGMALVDVHRHVYPVCRLPTFVSSTGVSIIDRIFLEKNHIDRVKNSLIINYPYSDHRAILVQFENSGSCIEKHSSPYWKMNVKYMHDPEFKLNMNKTIKETVTKNSPYTNSGDWWEDCKMCIKGLAIRFSKIKNQQTKFKFKFLSELLNHNLQLYEEGSLKDLKIYFEIKERMKKINETNLEGHAARGRFDHCVEHEELGMPQVIREIRNAKKKEINKIRDEGGELIVDRGKIRTFIDDYYKDVFTLEKKIPGILFTS